MELEGSQRGGVPDQVNTIRGFGVVFQVKS